MSCLKLKLLKQAKSAQSNRESPINRRRVLGWADEVLSKLKSDRNFLRQTVKKAKYEGENANVDSNVASSKENKPVGEGISQFNSNEVATCVSEIVASKMNRNVRHMAFDGSIAREKRKSKAVGKERVTNTEADENCDKQYKSKSKHEFNVSCNEDQECDLCRHEMCIRNRKKRKYNEDKSQKYFADSNCSESPFSDFQERPRKKNKLTEHYRCHGVCCCHFCKCASKEIRSQKGKKCEMPKDFHTDNKNDSTAEKVEDSTTRKQEKIKKLKHTLDSVLGKGDQLSNRDASKEDRKEKEKEKRYYKHSVSEECISERKKLKKYKLYTEKYKSDESRCTSEREVKMSGKEMETFERCCCLCESGERRRHKHCHAFNEKLEETKDQCFWHGPCKTEFASNRNQQKSVKENSHNTVEYKRKGLSEKCHTYIESEIISERTKEHSDHSYYDVSDSEPERKKKRKQEKQNWKVNENVSDSEEIGKKKIYSNRNVVNVMEDSYIGEKQKKKHTETEKYYNFSVDTEGQNKKNKKHKRHKDNVSTDDNLQTSRSDVNPVEVSSTRTKQKKKCREVEEENYCNLSVDREERSKKKHKKIHKKEDRQEVNAIEVSSIQGKQKKHKKAEKEKDYNLSVDIEEESKKNRKKKRYEESAGTEGNLKIDNNDVSVMEASSVQDKRKKKHRETEKENCYNLSLDIEEKSKKNRKKKSYEDNTGTEDINAMEVSSVREKRKKKHKEAENEKSDNLSADIEEESKKNRIKKRYEENTGNENINAIEASSVQEKRKKKHKEAEKEKCYNLSVDMEEESKKSRKKKRYEENSGTKDNLKTDRNYVNAMEASSVQEKQKKKCKEVEKQEYSSLSVNTEEESKKKRGKEDVSTDNRLKTDEFMEDNALLNGASSNTKCSVKEQAKCCNTRQSQTEGMESVKPKINKDPSVIPKDKTRIEIMGSATIEDNIQYKKSDQSPEFVQSVSNFKENKSNYMQISALHDKNIKQSRKASNFGLSPIFRLLATEPDFSSTTHACQTCCRCKQHPDVAPSESARSSTENMSDVIIKIEPGIKIKQEKEDFDDSDPRIMDEQVLAVKPESQTEQSTDNMNKTDDAVRNVYSNDISIDNLTGKEEEVCAENSIGPNEYLFVKEDMGINETNNEFGIEEYTEDVNDEYIVNGNKETDIETPFHNMYDDKITVKEEIFHLTNVCYQSENRNHTEATSGVFSDCIGKQRTDYVGNVSELSSVGVLGSTYSTVTNMHRTTSVQEVNGLNLDAMTKCNTASLNEPVNRFSLDVIPKATDVQNAAWNGEEASSLYWPPLNRNEQQMSQLNDVQTFKTGRVNFTYVPKW
jgi:hypothetical protein